MQGRDYYLLASRTVCIGLAFASYFLPPIPSPDINMSRIFVVVKGATFLEIFMRVMFLVTHIGSLRNWLNVGPQFYCMYTFVFFDSVLAAVQFGSAAAAWGIMIDPRYNLSCDDPQALCRRHMISCGLALLTGGLGVADTLVLLVARLQSNGPRFLATIMGML